MPSRSSTGSTALVKAAMSAMPFHSRKNTGSVVDGSVPNAGGAVEVEIVVGVERGHRAVDDVPGAGQLVVLQRLEVELGQSGVDDRRAAGVDRHVRRVDRGVEAAAAGQPAVPLRPLEARRRAAGRRRSRCGRGGARSRCSRRRRRPGSRRRSRRRRERRGQPAFGRRIVAQAVDDRASSPRRPPGAAGGSGS